MLTFDGEKVIQESDQTSRIWTIPELLDTYDPLSGESAAERNALIQQVIPAAADRYRQLSEVARLRYDFWKNIVPQRIEPTIFEYTARVSDTYRWRSELNADGLFYTDISGEYGSAGHTYFQLLSDFWFCGPAMPLPALEHKKKLIAQIRNAFRQEGSPACNAHFPLFTYPDFSGQNPPQWSTGDYRAGDFVILRQHGVDYGSHNFHDGLVFLAFVSFEQVLRRRDIAGAVLTPQILADIRGYLPAGVIPLGAADTFSSAPGLSREERKKQLFLENGDMADDIYRNRPSDEDEHIPQDETSRQQELIGTYTRRLLEERNETELHSVVQTLLSHQVRGVDDLLLQRAATASNREKQTIAILLWDRCQSEKSVDVLLTLLTEEDDGYWRNYVFSTFAKRRQSRRVQEWVLAQLQGNDPFLFHKAVDILRMWGMYGEQRLLDFQLFRPVTWVEKMEQSPAFKKAIQEIKHIIQSH